MNCDEISRKITEDNLNGDPTTGFGLLFMVSVIAVPVRINAKSILCVTEDSRLAELHFKQLGQSFTCTRHLHQNTLLTVEVRMRYGSREVMLFLGAAERLERY
ncbi:hypothetical protein EAG21025_42710 (plasmid) [Enterobacter asburiae]|uniref:hypothetical protein n=1 Tax=Enterobacter cloacae complex TaxID=354276 RepID=UPI002A801300|nr:hypothetical protein [Enterobacter kobei]HDJ1437344.1 hypothetical protein [Enterobacter asburiae]HDJ1437582.1 hypothetical protein [Enterobacter asburiae]